MPSRRALLIAPTYDGRLCSAVPSAAELLRDLGEILSRGGGYDVKLLDGVVGMPELRSLLHELFKTDGGEVLVYFYGHGLLRDPAATVLCRSQAVEGDEGLGLAELLTLAGASEAREAIVIADACRSGVGWAPHHLAVHAEASPLILRPGRAFLAACRTSQESVIEEDSKGLSRFSRLVLDGLRGAALGPAGGDVSASALFRFVADGITEWGQDPVMVDVETGQHRCRIVTMTASMQDAPTPVLGKRLGLPFRPSARFVGREAEIDVLTQVLCDDNRPLALAATIEGLGGVGKTELVLHLLEEPRVRAAFPSVLWFDASAPLEPQWAHFASKLGVESEQREPDSERVMRELAKHGGRVLAVLDNATSWVELSGNVPADAAILVTTRSRYFGDGSFIRREIRPLSPEAGVALLQDLLPNAEELILHKLAKRLGGHALALELAGHYIADLCTPEEYLERFDTLSQRASQEIAGKTHYGRTVEHCLEVSWDGLAQDSARSLWIRASLFAPTSAHRDLLRATSTWERARRFVEEPLEYFSDSYGRGQPHLLPDSDFDDAYRSLRAANVLERVEGFNGERWSMHRLVQDFARQRMDRLDGITHAAAFTGWLREPTVPLEPEIPHIISAVMELARSGADYPARAELYARRSHLRTWGEFRYVLGDALLSSLAAGSNGPQAIGLIFEGVADANEDVRAQAVELINQLGPTDEILAAVKRTLDDPSDAVRKRAVEALLTGGTWSRERLVADALDMSDRGFETFLERLVAAHDGDAVERLIPALPRATERQALEIEIARAQLGFTAAAGPLLGALSSEPTGPRRRRVERALAVLLRSDDPTIIGPLSTAAEGSGETALYAASELARRGMREGAEHVMRIKQELGDFGTLPPRQVLDAVMFAAPDLVPEIAKDLDTKLIQAMVEARSTEDLESALVIWTDSSAWDLAAVAREKIAARAVAAQEEARREAEAQAKKLAAETRRKAAMAAGPVGGSLAGSSKAGDWSRWADAERLAAERTAKGTPTESPRQAWQRTWLAEVNAGTNLGAAQAAAKAARNAAAAELVPPAP